ncbi:hypothetical protein BH11BAC6_BH11BAC6_07160 [soil metagenome]
MALLEADLSNQLENNTKEADLVHLFSVSRKNLEKDFKKIIVAAKEGLVIWISSYKKSSGMQKDITEDIIREIVLPKG